MPCIGFPLVFGFVAEALSRRQLAKSRSRLCLLLLFYDHTHSLASTMGRKSSDSTVKTSAKKASVALVTTKKSPADAAKSSASRKDQQSKSKPVNSRLTVAKPLGNSDQKPVGKQQKVVAQLVQDDGEESEEEWVGFGSTSKESGDDDEDEGGEEDSDSSEEELLHGLSSGDDQDSSDEEIELPGLDVSKLPTIAKDDQTVKLKLEKAKRKSVRVTSFFSFFFLLQKLLWVL